MLRYHGYVNMSESFEVHTSMLAPYDMNRDADWYRLTDESFNLVAERFDNPSKAIASAYESRHAPASLQHQPPKVPAVSQATFEPGPSLYGHSASANSETAKATEPINQSTYSKLSSGLGWVYDLTDNYSLLNNSRFRQRKPSQKDTDIRKTRLQQFCDLLQSAITLGMEAASAVQEWTRSNIIQTVLRITRRGREENAQDNVNSTTLSLAQ